MSIHYNQLSACILCRRIATKGDRYYALKIDVKGNLGWKTVSAPKYTFKWCTLTVLGVYSQHLVWFYFFWIFKFPARCPCLFLQSLMGNYDVIALSCISNTAATVSISGIKIYEHASNAYLPQTFMVILWNCPLWTPFKICDNAMTSQITIKKTWRRAGNLNWKTNTSHWNQLQSYRLKTQEPGKENH